MSAPKYLTAIDKDGIPKECSVEDLIAARQNRFKGWTCNAGLQTLYIDYDGTVWIANCAGAVNNPNTNAIGHISEEWGYVGTILEDDYTWPTKPVICPMTSCGCGADVCTSKAAQPVTLRYNHVELIRPVQSETNLVSVSMNYPWPKHVLWDIGRWCNYSCSYCWPSVHNKTDPHKKFDVMKQAVDRVVDEWAGGGHVRWAFGGGEPTVNPDFLPLIEYIRNRGGYILVVSNGSRNTDYYYKLAWAVDCMQLSLHSEFWKPEQFVKNIESILKAYKDKGGGWLDIKMMCKPGIVREMVEWKQKFEEIFNDDNNKRINPQSRRLNTQGCAVLTPIRDLNDSGELTDYDPEELELLRKNS